jgi:hypothetical protein
MMIVWCDKSGGLWLIIWYNFMLTATYVNMYMTESPLLISGVSKEDCDEEAESRNCGLNGVVGATFEQRA